MRKRFLHVGCGMPNPKKMDTLFPPTEWEEVRLDIDPNVKPDIISDITKMDQVPDNAYEALFSSHNLEHLYPHQVLTALAEFYRVLKIGGCAYVRVPNIQEVAEIIAKDKLEEPLYISPAGAVSAIDILYGFRPSVATGNLFMAHRTAFTPRSLGEKMIITGFGQVSVRSDGDLYSMEAIGYKIQK